AAPGVHPRPGDRARTLRRAAIHSPAGDAGDVQLGRVDSALGSLLGLPQPRIPVFFTNRPRRKSAFSPGVPDAALCADPYRPPSRRHAIVTTGQVDTDWRPVERADTWRDHGSATDRYTVHHGHSVRRASR